MYQLPGVYGLGVYDLHRFMRIEISMEKLPIYAPAENTGCCPLALERTSKQTAQ